MSKAGDSKPSERGQSLVEFTIIIPLILMLLLVISEFGMMLNHHMSLEYATREGARTGAALVNGGGALGCGAGQSPNASQVDPRIIAAVQRVLDSSGSNINVANVIQIRIYSATSTGDVSGSSVNVWTYTPGAGPVVDGHQLNFSPSSVPWAACSRTNVINGSTPPGSIGVDITYTYSFETPLGSVMRLITGGMATSVAMTDRTVMQLEPTNLTLPAT